MSFRTSLKVELVDHIDSGTWRLLAPLVYWSQLTQASIVVPDGFVTDFASVPRVWFAYLLTGNTAHAPAVVHDYLYRTRLYPRELCDKVFLEAMESVDVPEWRRNLIFSGVRLGGSVYYDNGANK